MEQIGKLAGIAGLVLGGMLALAFVLDFTIIATTGGPPMVQLSSLQADMVRLRGNALWSFDTWIYALSIVPASVFVVGAWSALRATGQGALAGVAAIAFVLFQLTHMLHNLALLAVIQLLASSSYVPGSGDAAALEAVTRGLLGFAYATFDMGLGVGTAFFVVGMLAFAAAQRRTRSRVWTLALASALLVAVGALQGVFFPTLFVALVGWVCGIAWTIATSLRLLGGIGLGDELGEVQHLHRSPPPA